MVKLKRKKPFLVRAFINFILDVALVLFPSKFHSKISFGYDKKGRLWLNFVQVSYNPKRPELTITKHGQHMKNLKGCVTFSMQKRLSCKLNFKDSSGFIDLYRTTGARYVILVVYPQNSQIDYVDLCGMNTYGAEKIYFEYLYKIQHIHDME